MRDFDVSAKPKDRTHGELENFPTTNWSLVLRAGRTDAPEAAPALQRLCQSYWYPLYAFIRRRGFSAHDAEDIAQSFFAQLLEKNALARVEPERERGRFRSFLLASLTNFLTNEWHKARTQKRGGGRAFVAWESLSAEERFQNEPTDDAANPEKLFDRRWAEAMIELAMQRLEAEYRDTGKGALFDSLKTFLTKRPDSGDYAQLAQSLSMNEGALKTTLHRLRKKFGEALRREVAHTVANADDIEDEMRHLLATLSAGVV